MFAPRGGYALRCRVGIHEEPVVTSGARASPARGTPKPVLDRPVLHIPYQAVSAGEGGTLTARAGAESTLDRLVAVGLVDGGKLGAEAEWPSGDAPQGDDGGEALAQAQQGVEIGVVGIGGVAALQ